MKKNLILLLLLFSFSLFGADVFVIEIRGTINPATSRYMTRAIEAGEKSQADFILVELDTPGGLLTSVREMAQKIDQSRIPVIVYTSPAGASATSAGAILMISSHLAAMAPGTNIGAAHPVDLQDEDKKNVRAEKAVNDVSAFARSVAELRKRNTTAAGEVVSKSNSYTAEEAKNANLIEIIATDRNDLWKQIHRKKIQMGQKTIELRTDPPPVLNSIKMTFGESALSYISHPNIAALLMTLGIMLIYAEFASAGFGIAGVLGGLCFIVAFIAFQMLPIKTGGLLLIVTGIAFIIAEVFIGSGGLAVGGSIALVLGLLWVVDPNLTDLRISPWVIGPIGLFVLSGTLLITYGVARTRRQSEETFQRIGGGDLTGLKGYHGRIQDTSSDGKTGQVMIRGELWSFTASEPMAIGDSVVVTAASGLKVKVSKNINKE